MSVRALYKDIFAENSQTFVMTGQQGLIYRFEIDFKNMKYMPKQRVNQIARLEILDLRNMVQNINSGELIAADREMLELSLTEG